LELEKRSFKVLFGPYAEEAGIQKSRKAADLLEVIMEMARNQNHYLWRQLKEFMDMVHYLEVYREIIIPPVCILRPVFGMRWPASHLLLPCLKGTKGISWQNSGRAKLRTTFLGLALAKKVGWAAAAVFA
jgi:hypothetical protein